MKVRVKKGLAHDLDTSMWEKKGRLRVEVIVSLAESVHPVCLSATQLDPWPASQYLTWPQHESSPPNTPQTG